MGSLDKKRGIGGFRRERLNRDNEKVSTPVKVLRPGLREARSLPALSCLDSIKFVTTADLDELLVPTPEQTPLLSPLKISRRAGNASAAQSLNFVGQRPDSVYVFSTRNTGSRLSTRRQNSQVARNTEDIRGAVVATELQNSLTHSTKTEDYAFQERTQRLEIIRRKATADAALQNFFDRLSFMAIRDAVDVFETQHEGLLDFCLQQFRGLVDGSQLKAFHNEFMAIMAKEEKDLQSKLKNLLQEEMKAAQKKNELQTLKKSHLEQIEQHIANAKAQRKQDLAARYDIQKEQERLDQSFEARVRERKLQVEVNNAKLVEQIKCNAVASRTFHPTPNGSSPVYRTPWWSDESEERLTGFQRPTTVQWPAQSPVIHSRRRCQWYD